MLPAVRNGSFFNIMEKQLILHILNKGSMTTIKLENTSESEDNNFDSSILHSNKDIIEELENIGSIEDDMNNKDKDGE